MIEKNSILEEIKELSEVEEQDNPSARLSGRINENSAKIDLEVGQRPSVKQDNSSSELRKKSKPLSPKPKTRNHDKLQRINS